MKQVLRCEQIVTDRELQGMWCELLCSSLRYELLNATEMVKI